MNKCKYCGCVEGVDHKNTCPTKDGNPEWAKAEWEKGFHNGIERGDVAYWWHYVSKPYIRGYDKGLIELGHMLDVADNLRRDPEY